MSYNNQATIIRDLGYFSKRYNMIRFHNTMERINMVGNQIFLNGILRGINGNLYPDLAAYSGGGLYLFRGDTTAYYKNICMSGSINRNTSVGGKIRFVLGATTSGLSDTRWTTPLSQLSTNSQPINGRDTYDYINSTLSKDPFNLAISDVKYYYAEIDFTTRIFSIGYQSGIKSNILKRLILPQAQMITGDLVFTAFDKENGILECSAKFVRSNGQTFELTTDLVGHNSYGQFGVYLFNPGSEIKNFDFGVRGADNKYIICQPSKREFSIRFVYNDTIRFDVPAYLAQVVDGVNRIFEQHFLDTKFTILESVPETFIEDNPFLYTGAGGDFNYAVIAHNVSCTCGNICAVGCAYYPGFSCVGTGWISLYNSLTTDICLLAHELGHSLGAAHITNPPGTIMLPTISSSNRYAPQSITEISGGINGPCLSKADIIPSIEEYGYVPPSPPEPPQPPPPSPPDTFSSFIFTRQLPETLRLLDNQDSISLLIAIWPVNNRGERLSQTAALAVTSPCRQLPGCYVWERRYDNGSWSTIQSLKAPEGRKYNNIFSLPSQYSSMQIRCVVTIQGVTKISNVCTVYRRQINTKYTFTNYIENFIYPADIPIYQLDNLPESVKQCLMYITTPRKLGSVQVEDTVWANTGLPFRSASNTSWYRLLPGQQYKIYFKQPRQRPASISVANLPITIDWVPNLGGAGAASAVNPSDIGDIPTYNYDNSWVATVNNNDTILFDKQMIVPIDSINNIEYINKIYTQQDNKLYIWKKNYPLSNLKTLNSTMTYIIETESNDPVELSYIIDETPTPSITPTPTPTP